MKELSDQTRAAIFFVFAIIVFLVWSHYFLPAAPTPAQLQQKAAEQQAAPSVPAPAHTAAPGVPANVAVIQAAAEKPLVVDSPLYRVQISNRGGVVQSWQVKKYLDNEKPPRPLDLVNQSTSQELGWPLSLRLDDPDLEAKANSALYQIAPSGIAAQAPASVTMQWSDGHLSVTKKLDFGNNYDVSLEASVLLDGKPIPFALAWRGQFGDPAVNQAPQTVTVFYKQNGKLNSLQYKSLGVPSNRIMPYEQGGPMEYAGIQDQFFAAAFMSQNGDLKLWDWTQWHHYPDENGQKRDPDPEAQIAVGPMTPGPLSARLFIGPKDLEVLRRQNPSLEELINFGWFAVIAKPLLYALQWMYRYIPNYGWVIVLFTILLNMALFPVKIWTFKSTRKMQIVAPEIKAIQDRYKKYSMRDPRKQKMNEEVMAVYQREGINPVGSCLPMLVQIPLIYAFYRVLAYSIELRHAPWFGWIHDLSARDPYYILPIAMGLTTYLATKMTPMPTTVDPAQQKMMLMMPLMFVVFLFRYASGLSLYYLTVNVVGAGQQWYLNRSQPLPSRSKFKKNRE